MGNSTDVINFRKRRKLNLMKVAGNKCCLCGYDKIPDALEFHHIIPEEKEYAISSNGVCHDLELDLAEVKKCILIWQEKEKLFEKKEYYCSSCGKKLYDKDKTGLCPECYKKTTRKAERPSREELKDLIRKIPFTEIAFKYGVSDNAVRKWCDAVNLPRKKVEINQYSDTEWSKIWVRYSLTD